MIQCLMPPDHDRRCPWPHVNVDPDHLIQLDRVQTDHERASARLRCNVGGCFTATVSIEPADSMQQLVYLLGLGHQVHINGGTWAT